MDGETDYDIMTQTVWLGTCHGYKCYLIFYHTPTAERSHGKGEGSI